VAFKPSDISVELGTPDKVDNLPDDLFPALGVAAKDTLILADGLGGISCEAFGCRVERGGR
jgi:hypothetical protein